MASLPCVDIDDETEKRKIVHFNGRDTDSQMLRSYSDICKEVNEKMDADTKERLDNYLELLDEISEKTSDENIAVLFGTQVAPFSALPAIRLIRICYHTP
jgi:hypothetical protein